MRTITAVASGTEATWTEASEFHPNGCLRLWVELSFPTDLQRYIAKFIPAKPRGGKPHRLSETRVLHGTQGVRVQ